MNCISHYLKTKNEQLKIYILKLTINSIGKLANWRIRKLIQGGIKKMSNQRLSEFDIQEAIKNVANLMGVSARTAPKSAGKDFVVIKVIYEEEVNRLAEEMVHYGEEFSKKNFDRDGDNVKNSLAVLLILIFNFSLGRGNTFINPIFLFKGPIIFTFAKCGLYPHK